MAGYENIKDKGFDKRTTEELRVISSQGGKASGESRRRTARLRDTANRLLTMQAEVPGLSDILRADGGESTYEEIIVMAMIQQAAMGDVKAFNAIKSTIGQTDKSDADLEEQRIRTDRAKRARDQEVGDTDRSEENIQNFLKALNPSPEDLEGLFDNEEETEEDGEKEETDSV